MNQIFISYSHKDKTYAHKLHQYLIERDFNAWIDDKIDYGSRWRNQVEKKLRECYVFILVMSPNSEESEWVQNELYLAKQLNKTIYTFLLDGNVWWDVRSIQYVDVRNGQMPTEKFILSLAKIISESEDKDSKNVIINVGGNVQGNIIVGDRNKIDSSVNMEEEIVDDEQKEYAKPFTRILNHSSLVTQKEPELKQYAQNRNFRRLGIGGIILIVVLGILFAGNYIFNNLPINETSETTPTEVVITSTSAPTVTAAKSLPVSTTTRFGIGSTTLGDDGMVLMYVPADEFIMGTDAESSNESPEHQVYLDAYWIDSTEITNAMYARCVEENQCNSPDKANSARRLEYFGSPEFDDYPVIFVSWNDANDYCFWAGRRLPTEAEWEKAARGTDGKIYPWGNTEPKNNLLNYNGNVGDTTLVGSYPTGASEYGVFDMAGNVWEWVEDWWSPNYYKTPQPENPQGPDVGEYKVLRGGSWSGLNNIVRSTYRYAFVPTITDGFFGFRCAMDADQ